MATATTSENNLVVVTTGNPTGSAMAMFEIDRFNKEVLPFLRDCGAFDKKNIDAYDNVLTREYLRPRYSMELISSAKTDKEKEYARIISEERFNKYLEEHPIPQPLNRTTIITDSLLRFVHYDDAQEKFVFDREAHERSFYIYAKTSEEKETLARLTAALEALNRIGFGRRGLLDLFSISNGKVVMRGGLSVKLWNEIVAATAKIK